jgi:hypothetical protein
MQISVDVHNYMETLVGSRLAKPEFTEKYDNEQLADLACITLNQLRPIYIRYDIDFLSSVPDNRLAQYRKQVDDALLAAETMINDDRRQNRDLDDIPVVYRDLSEEEDPEMDWFEKPILPIKK